jgi:hypothetical protein
MADMEAELTDLRARVARLEAAEEVRSVLHRYACLVDIGLLDELVTEVLAPDVALHLINFPPGDQGDVELSGADEVRALYGQWTPETPMLTGGHHLTNLNVTVSEDAGTAEASAYHLFTGLPLAQGGLYQARLALLDGRWKIVEMNIVSTWGWVPTAAEPVTEALAPSRAWRDGRPVLPGLA